ncbi:hypothetical protein D9611_011429 [Ephemerocybe angulata]|uniref:CHAT domain-containing protein n=1 Tax=Ephemerocybe angulata TaxID=980116 RepID=A0A8H5CD64_9AGAR|nr:hypothetical protein D9611_011429 [Tulosesus angulatus]
MSLTRLAFVKQERQALLARLSNRGLECRKRFEETGDLSDLTKAIEAWQGAISLFKPRNQDRHRWLVLLGVALFDRFGRTGELADINEAISALWKVVRCTPRGHALLIGRLNHLESFFQARFKLTGNGSNLRNATWAKDKVVEFTGGGFGHFPPLLRSRYREMTVDSEDPTELDEVIAFSRILIERTAKGHPNTAEVLDYARENIQFRYRRKGTALDLSEIIHLGYRVVQLTPDDHPSIIKRLRNLGQSYASRFARFSNASDLAEARILLKRVVEATPEDDPDFPDLLCSLGRLLGSPHDHACNLSDLAEAIRLEQKAIELTRTGDVRLPPRIACLGMTFQLRFERFGDLSDSDEALSLLTRAIRLTQEGRRKHSDWFGMLAGYAQALRHRFIHTKNPSYIDKSISTSQMLIKLCPEGHPDNPTFTLGLATSMYTRATSNGDRGELDASISLYRSVATSSLVPPMTRLDAAGHWARYLNLHHPLSEDVITAFDTAIGLFAFTVSLDQSMKHRYARLQENPGLPLEAAAAACRLGRLEKAFEWLEQGRCLVWAQLNNLRTPIDDLKAHNRKLGNAVIRVAEQLEGAVSRTSETGATLTEKMLNEDVARKHLQLAAEWDDLLATVRDIPGFETFMKPLSFFSRLQDLPGEGPIVVINIYPDRCDAIALVAGQGQPLHIPLPNFSASKADLYRANLRSQLKSHNLRERGGLGDPVDCTERGCSGCSPRSVERGCKTYLKCIKALGYVLISHLRVGYHREFGGALQERSPSSQSMQLESKAKTRLTLIDRVKNSRGRDRWGRCGINGINRHAGLFLASQPNAPGAYPIPGTTREVESVYELIRNEAQMEAHMLQGSKLTIDDCLSFMDYYSSVHFACHASQNAADPLESRFIFHEGSLNLLAVIRRNLQDSDLAFLSACQTSTGEEKLSDEAVHLAAGMLAAGYRRVVATMWSIGDRHAPGVSLDFYQHLWKDNKDRFDGEKSAQALHHAMQSLRLRLNDDSEKSLLAWIPYVHFGY